MKKTITRTLAILLAILLTLGTGMAASAIESPKPTEPDESTTLIEPKDLEAIIELYAGSDALVAGAAAGATNLQNAIAYADKWTKNNCATYNNVGDCYFNERHTCWKQRRNSAYPNPGTRLSDCVNFVSQCLVAGGISTNSVWTPGRSEWNTCSDFMKAFMDRGITLITNPSYKNATLKALKGEDGYNHKNAVMRAVTSADIEPGDVVFVDGSEGYATHAAFCVAKSGSTLYYDAHSTDRNRYSGMGTIHAVLKTSKLFGGTTPTAKLPTGWYEVTSTAGYLNIRSGPSTSNTTIVGKLAKGDQREIDSVTLTSAGFNWGRIKGTTNNWINIDPPYCKKVSAPASTYTITYNANGGSGAPASQTKKQGVTLTLSNTKPTRSGYGFLGWATSNTATAATYPSGSNFSKDASTTLYAVWIKYLPGTKYEATPLNSFLYYVCFGWIWMRLVKPA